MNARQQLIASMRNLYGDGHGADAGAAVARQRIPAALLHYHAVDGAILAEISDGGILRRLRLQHADHPELLHLGDRDRAMLQGALMAMSREVGNG